MQDPSRRSFLVAALAMALGGCTTGYYLGTGERVQADPFPPPKPSEEVPVRPLKLYEKDPVLAGRTEDRWIPDLDPLPRSCWAGTAPIRHRLAPMGRVTRITVHHEGAPTPNEHTLLEDVAADLRDIQRVHLRDMTAGDIGYHYVIDRVGRIWSGRSTVYQGAHAGGEANVGNLGIMLLGNFDVQTPTDKQLKTLRLFLLKQMERFRVPVRRVHTHRELKPTRCPGTHLQVFMDRFRLDPSPDAGELHR